MLVHLFRQRHRLILAAGPRAHPPNKEFGYAAGTEPGTEEIPRAFLLNTWPQKGELSPTA